MGDLSSSLEQFEQFFVRNGKPILRLQASKTYINLPHLYSFEIENFSQFVRHI